MATTRHVPSSLAGTDRSACATCRPCLEALTIAEDVASRDRRQCIRAGACRRIGSRDDVGAADAERTVRDDADHRRGLQPRPVERPGYWSSDIRLFHEPAVNEGRRHRNLLARLAPEIEKARQAYNEQVPAGVRAHTDYFHQELINTLAGGDAALLGNLV